MGGNYQGSVVDATIANASSFMNLQQAQVAHSIDVVE